MPHQERWSLECFSQKITPSTSTMILPSYKSRRSGRTTNPWPPRKSTRLALRQILTRVRNHSHSWSHPTTAARIVLGQFPPHHSLSTRTAQSFLRNAMICRWITRAQFRTWPTTFWKVSITQTYRKIISNTWNLYLSHKQLSIVSKKKGSSHKSNISKYLLRDQIKAHWPPLIRKRRDVRKMKGKLQQRTIYKTSHLLQPKRSHTFRRTQYSSNRWIEVRARQARQIPRLMPQSRSKPQARPCRK